MNASRETIRTSRINRMPFPFLILVHHLIKITTHKSRTIVMGINSIKIIPKHIMLSRISTSLDYTKHPRVNKMIYLNHSMQLLSRLSNTSNGDDIIMLG